MINGRRELSSGVESSRRRACPAAEIEGDGMKAWVLFIAGLLFFGCASTKDVKLLDRETDRLRSEILILQNQNKSNQEQISELKAQNQKLKADFHLQLENLRAETTALSTSIEEYKELLKQPSKDMNQMKVDIDSRLKVLEERRKSQEEKIKELESRQEKTASTLKPTEPEKAGLGKEIPAELKGLSTGMGDLYKDAYESYHKGDLEGARKKFEAFLKQYPNTDLSDNAQFWIGETYFLKRDYERAILEYEKAIVKYPEGDKIPAALFKQAVAFLELGDRTNARNLLKRVIEKYPQSDQAELAKKKLDIIK